MKWQVFDQEGSKRDGGVVGETEDGFGVDESEVGDFEESQ
jgi:hypothetical protein